MTFRVFFQKIYYICVAVLTVFLNLFQDEIHLQDEILFLQYKILVSWESCLMRKESWNSDLVNGGNLLLSGTVHKQVIFIWGKLQLHWKVQSGSINILKRHKKFFPYNTRFRGRLVTSLICLNMTSFGCVTAQCGSSQTPTFYPCSP